MTAVLAWQHSSEKPLYGMQSYLNRSKSLDMYKGNTVSAYEVRDMRKPGFIGEGAVMFWTYLVCGNRVRRIT